MNSRVGSAAGGTRRPCYRWRYLFVLVVAVALSFGVAMPVFAAVEGDIQTRIVGGTEVPDGKYAFVASVGDARFGSTAYDRHFCGGSLIDRNSVLTAAHCVQGSLPQPLRVTVGRTVLTSSQGQMRGVSHIAIHPRYRGITNQAYDAAVLTLNSPVTGIAPIKLAGAAQDSLERPGRRATIAGWGNTIKQPPGGNNRSNYPNRMREARVPIVSDATARSVYGSQYVARLMVAAGREGKDTCAGDSGGPMFASLSTGRYQIGITSFGAGCGARGYPGVYSEVNASAIRTFVVNAASR